MNDWQGIFIDLKWLQIRLGPRHLIGIVMVGTGTAILMLSGDAAGLRDMFMETVKRLLERL